jgi:hypothetical protein
MSDLFLEELNMPTSNFNLDIGGGMHCQNAGHIIEAIKGVTTKGEAN